MIAHANADSMLPALGVARPCCMDQPVDMTVEAASLHVRSGPCKRTFQRPERSGEVCPISIIGRPPPALSQGTRCALRNRATNATLNGAAGPEVSFQSPRSNPRGADRSHGQDRWRLLYRTTSPMGCAAH